MKRTNALTLVAVLSLGVLLGVYARPGGAPVSKGAPVVQADRSSEIVRVRNSTGVVTGSAAAQCVADDDCLEGEICHDDRCFETCQNAADCTDDGLDCTEPMCNPVDPPGDTRKVCSHVCREPNGPSDPTATHLVATPLDTVDDARSVGVWGECDATVPAEECVFTVEAVQYSRFLQTPSPDPTLIRFVCVDLNVNGDIPTCSPVERDPIWLGPTISIAPHVKAEAGVAAAIFGSGGAGLGLGFAYQQPIPVHRRFRYPLQRAFTGRVGGNILIESGIGSIVATESVVFGHGRADGGTFSGRVTFFVTKPEGMSLTLGFKQLDGDPVCVPDPCPMDFADVLTSAASRGRPGATLAGDTGFESDFDIQELIDALDNEAQTIKDITDELKGRIEEKIPEVFDRLREFLGSGGSSASTAQRSELVDQMMNLLRERIRENLDEIRDIARDLVSCPE